MSKKVLITGASGGFGKLTVKTLLEKGYSVAASMRGINAKNKGVADELQGLGAQIVEIDVTDDTSVENGVQKAVDLLQGLDIVINNAGVGTLGMQEHFTVADYQKLFEINVFGVQRINRAAIPHLRKQKSGVIIYISSLLGRMALPFYGPYNSSKWALEALAENYRVELSGFGIENCIIEPGGYPTTFMESLLMPSDQSRDTEYGEFLHAPKAMFAGFEQALHSNPAQNPQNVADAIAEVLQMPIGEKPFRTVVDSIGMGTPLTEYNQQLEQIMNGAYSNFGMNQMLKVQG